MVWPIDAKLVTAAAGAVIPSNLDNEEQDRIVDLHRIRQAILGPPVVRETAGVADWVDNSIATVHPIWICVQTSKISFILTGLNHKSGNGSIVNEVVVKVQNTGVPSMVADLYTNDVKFDTAATGPVGSALQAGPVAAVNNGGYDSIVLTPAAPYTLTDDLVSWVEITGATINDQIHGVRVEYQPITPTP